MQSPSPSTCPRWCGYCVRAKALLDAKGLAYEEISLGFRRTLFDLPGGRSLPQILFEDRSIGGYAELWRLDATGALDETFADRRKTPP